MAGDRAQPRHDKLDHPLQRPGRRPGADRTRWPRGTHGVGRTGRTDRTGRVDRADRTGRVGRTGWVDRTRGSRRSDRCHRAAGRDRRPGSCRPSRHRRQGILVTCHLVKTHGRITATKCKATVVVKAASATVGLRLARGKAIYATGRSIVGPCGRATFALRERRALRRGKTYGLTLVVTRHGTAQTAIGTVRIR